MTVGKQLWMYLSIILSTTDVLNNRYKRIEVRIKCWFFFLSLKNQTGEFWQILLCKNIMLKR